MSIITNYYKVAEHLFCVTAQADDLGLMQNYTPFCCEPECGTEPVFSLSVSDGDAVSFNEEIRQSEEGQEIVCGKAGSDPAFSFLWAGRAAGWLVCSTDYRRGQLVLSGYQRKSAIDNALMVLFALATAQQGTAVFHASAVSYKGRAYMNLGKSGTGKSTHAALWLRHIEGTELINDDNPVVRVYADGSAVIYGTPWSGKTPCYRNVSYPLGGIVQLSQAPYNKIRRLGGVEAYASLVASISGKRWDRCIADGLHATENSLVRNVPVWHLECLPNDEAALLCRNSIAQ